MNQIRIPFLLAVLAIAVFVPCLSAPAFAVDVRAPIRGKCESVVTEVRDGPAGLETLGHLIAENFIGTDPISGLYLNMFITDWDSPSCVLDDGRPYLTAVTSGLKKGFLAQNDWSKGLARIDQLKNQFPDAAFPLMIEAQYWIEYAWNARGGGYASTVAADGMRLFTERLIKAEKVLQDSKSKASTLPIWYEQMTFVKLGLGRPREEGFAVFSEGAERYKSFLPTYFTLLLSIEPKWGGNWQAVESFATWSAENTRATDGSSLYARIYWAVAQGFNSSSNLFQETKASWPRMKKGFDDLMARHPRSSWNLNNYAQLACSAGDKDSFLEARKRMGEKIESGAWGRAPTLEVCERKFGYKD